MIALLESLASQMTALGTIAAHLLGFMYIAVFLLMAIVFFLAVGRRAV